MSRDKSVELVAVSCDVDVSNRRSFGVEASSGTPRARNFSLAASRSLRMRATSLYAISYLLRMALTFFQSPTFSKLKWLRSAMTASSAARAGFAASACAASA